MCVVEIFLKQIIKTIRNINKYCLKKTLIHLIIIIIIIVIVMVTDIFHIHSLLFWVTFILFVHQCFRLGMLFSFTILALMIQCCRYHVGSLCDVQLQSFVLGVIEGCLPKCRFQPICHPCLQSTN